MSYRDDVDAVYERAVALQREVDRLRAELDERTASVEAVRRRATLEVQGSRAELERQLAELGRRATRAEAARQRAVREAEAAQAEVARLRDQLEAEAATEADRAGGMIRVPAHMRERTLPVWLPPSARATARAAAAPSRPAREDGDDGDGAEDDLGLLVARLTRAEHRVVARLLELLTEDDFSAPAVERNLRALGRLTAELRRHVASDE